MIWGVDGAGKIKEKLLEHLGLVCYGGSSSENEKMTYHVFSNNDSFNIHLTEEEMNDIDSIYKKWKRKQKIIKLNEQ